MFSLTLYHMCQYNVYVHHSPIQASNCKIDSPGSNLAQLDCMHIWILLHFMSPIWASRFEINWSAGKIRTVTSERASINIHTTISTDHQPKDWQLPRFWSPTFQENFFKNVSVNTEKRFTLHFTWFLSLSR